MKQFGLIFLFLFILTHFLQIELLYAQTTSPIKFIKNYRRETLINNNKGVTLNQDAPKEPAPADGKAPSPAPGKAPAKTPDAKVPSNGKVPATAKTPTATPSPAVKKDNTGVIVGSVIGGIIMKMLCQLLDQLKVKKLSTTPREIFISNNYQTIASNSTRNHQNYVVISPQQEENIIQQLRQELSKDIKNEVANQNAQLRKKYEKSN
ncbi:10211_t:CDS:2, partial [Funneliformis mosseae]